MGCAALNSVLLFIPPRADSNGDLWALGLPDLCRLLSLLFIFRLSFSAVAFRGVRSGCWHGYRRPRSSSVMQLLTSEPQPLWHFMEEIHFWRFRPDPAPSHLKENFDKFRPTACSFLVLHHPADFCQLYGHSSDHHHVIISVRETRQHQWRGASVTVCIRLRHTQQSSQTRRQTCNMQDSHDREETAGVSPAITATLMSHFTVRSH